MASNSRGNVTRISADTADLRELARLSRDAAHHMGNAYTFSGYAFKHENWQCSDRFKVSLEVNRIKASCKRIEGFLVELGNILDGSAAAFESTQQNIISKMQSVNYEGRA
ncbi:MAG: hypothetical protein LBE16_06830 [Clostridiales Family XIII bacterium]|jgi:hypothetical protein|nr:hypothetical protein [Clostridiales Family XIII bacterium]